MIQLARFVSQNANLHVTVRNGKEEQRVFDEDGRTRIKPGVRELEAVFSHSLLTQKDALEAKSRLRFVGTVEDQTGRPIDPSYRISVFDSELAKLQNGWTDKEEQMVVEFLRNNGENGSAYVEVFPEKVAKPWPGYDEVESAEQIVEIANTIGADFEQIIAYEQENRNSPTVIAALKEAKAEEADVVIVSA